MWGQHLRDDDEAAFTFPHLDVANRGLFALLLLDLRPLDDRQLRACVEVIEKVTDHISG